MDNRTLFFLIKYKGLILQIFLYAYLYCVLTKVNDSSVRKLRKIVRSIMLCCKLEPERECFCDPDCNYGSCWTVIICKS